MCKIDLPKLIIYIQMSLLSWLISWTGFKSSSTPKFALVLVDDSSKERHYRWLNLKDFQKALKKYNVGVSREFPPELFENANKISWIKECLAAGCAHNVFKIYLKDAEFCHLRSKKSLGQIIRDCQQQVFVKDNDVNWCNVQTVKFVPVDSKICYDSRVYSLSEENGKLHVQRYYPDTEDF